MKIITVVSQKGGIGKTTISVSLAGALVQMFPHLKVAVADADPQGSATVWIDRSKGALGVSVHTVAADGTGLKLREELAAIDADIVIIDLPPAVALVALRAAIRADLMLVPTGASIVDLSATKVAVDLCKEAQEANPAKQYLIVPNRVQHNTAAGRELRGALEEWGKVSEATLTLRVAFQDAARVGLGVTQYAPGSPAAQEIGLLAGEVAALINIS